MNTTKVGMSSSCLVVGASLCLCMGSACSRQEPAKTPEPKVKTIAIAPTPLPSTNRPSGPVKSMRLEGTNAFHTLHRIPAPETPEARQALQERRKAMRERQQAFARDAVTKMLAGAEIDLDRELQALSLKEDDIRARDPAVKSAFEAMTTADKQYDKACADGIPEYAALTTEALTLKKQVDDYIARRNQGQTVDASALSTAHKRLNVVLRAVRELRLAANASNANVRLAFENAIKARDAYASTLDVNREYAEAKAGIRPTEDKVRDLASTQMKFKQE